MTDAERITELQARMSEMVSSSLARQVRTFMNATGQEVRTVPAIVDPDTYALRVRLVTEECNELLQAMTEMNLPEIADGIADLMYVLEGTAAAYGIHLKPIQDAVHAANMTKAGAPRDEHGKVQKPTGFVPPDVRSLLIEQGAKL